MKVDTGQQLPLLHSFDLTAYAPLDYYLERGLELTLFTIFVYGVYKLCKAMVS